MDAGSEPWEKTGRAVLMGFGEQVFERKKGSGWY